MGNGDGNSACADYRPCSGGIRQCQRRRDPMETRVPAESARRLIQSEGLRFARRCTLFLPRHVSDDMVDGRETNKKKYQAFGAGPYAPRTDRDVEADGVASIAHATPRDARRRTQALAEATSDMTIATVRNVCRSSLEESPSKAARSERIWALAGCPTDSQGL